MRRCEDIKELEPNDTECFEGDNNPTNIYDYEVAPVSEDDK